MLKILQHRLQQYLTCEIPDVQAGFRKGRGTRGQIANICWITEKAREFQKNIYFCFIYYAKYFDCGSKLWKILKEMRIPNDLICPLRNLSAVQDETEPDMEQWIVSKLWKEYVKAVYSQPAYLTSMQSTSCKITCWMKQNWNQDCLLKYQYLQICRWQTPPFGSKWSGTKDILHEVIKEM